MFVRFGRTIVNLEHITNIEFTSEDITIHTVDGDSATMGINMMKFEYPTAEAGKWQLFEASTGDNRLTL